MSIFQETLSNLLNADFDQDHPPTGDASNVTDHPPTGGIHSVHDDTASTNSDDRQFRGIDINGNSSLNTDVQPVENDLEDGEINHELPDDLLVQITRESKEVAGPVVSQALKAMVEGFFDRDFFHKDANESTLHKITSKFNTLSTPANLIEFFQPATVNDAVAKVAFRDAKARKLHSDAIKTETCHTKLACNHVLTIEKLIELKSKLSNNDQKTLIDTIIRSSALSLEFMGLQRFNIHQLRRDIITSHLNPQFKSLADSSGNANSNKLFGEELSKRLSDIEQTDRLSKKLAKPYDRPTSNGSKSFLGWRHTPYQNRPRRNYPVSTQSQPARQSRLPRDSKNYNLNHR